MSLRVNTIRKTKSPTVSGGWDKAIQDAKELLERVEQRADRLRGVIKTFMEYRDAGEPYSGSEDSKLSL